MKPHRTTVLVVDDTITYRMIVSRALALLPGVEVIGTANTGAIALSRIRSLKPDIVSLDQEMPDMSGTELLRQLKQEGLRPGVVMVSSHTQRGSQITVQALELGAFDFITKPEGTDREALLSQLSGSFRGVLEAYWRSRGRTVSFEKVEEALESGHPSHTSNPAHKRPAYFVNPPGGPGPKQPLRSKPSFVLIGVSTGGPNALAQLMPTLPKNLEAPVLIVQHMPPGFTAAMAESLNNKCALEVREARQGDAVRPGQVFIAPGGHHMGLVSGPDGSPAIEISDAPPENNCRPAVDYLFRSAAKNFPARSCAVILTGMGRDGTEGLAELAQKGVYAIAQDEASSVVYGMPREAAAAGLVDKVLPLSGIAEEIIHVVRYGPA
jgi:two-component system, chemotaxis family, protein-glutamate methylesterase/glutaminase